MDLHPLLVHFPITLLLVGALCDAIGILGRRDFYLKVGYLLIVLGAISSILSTVTGELAAETAHRIPHNTEDLECHETLGTILALLSTALVLARTHFTLKNRFQGTIQYGYLIALCILSGLAIASGHTGGRLVYDYGAGTQPIIQKLPETESVPKRIPRSDTFNATP